MERMFPSLADLGVCGSVVSSLDGWPETVLVHFQLERTHYDDNKFGIFEFMLHVDQEADITTHQSSTDNSMLVNIGSRACSLIHGMI